MVALGSYVVLLLARFPVAKRRGTLPAHWSRRQGSNGVRFRRIMGFRQGVLRRLRKTVNIKVRAAYSARPSFLFHAEPAAIRLSRRHLVSRRPQI